MEKRYNIISKTELKMHLDSIANSTFSNSIKIKDFMTNYCKDYYTSRMSYDFINSTSSVQKEKYSVQLAQLVNINYKYILKHIILRLWKTRTNTKKFDFSKVDYSYNYNKKELWQLINNQLKTK